MKFQGSARGGERGAVFWRGLFCDVPSAAPAGAVKGAPHTTVDSEGCWQLLGIDGNSNELIGFSKDSPGVGTLGNYKDSRGVSGILLDSEGFSRIL